MKIATLTSGGNAPGMNAAIRAIVRVAESYGHEVLAIGGERKNHWRAWNLPGTIDNDLFGTDRTIGFDTAVTTAM